MLEKWFVNTITIAKVTRNSYGDIVPSSQITTTGLLRDNITIVLNDNKEETDTDAMAWFPADTDIDKGDILYCESQAYRAIKVVRGKRGGSASVLFNKCYLQIDNSIVGVS